MDRVRNEVVHRRAGIEREFGQVKRMDEYRMTRRVLIADVNTGRVEGSPRLGWMDGVKVAFGSRGMTETTR